MDLRGIPNLDMIAFLGVMAMLGFIIGFFMDWLSNKKGWYCGDSKTRAQEAKKEWEKKDLDR